MRLAYEHRVRRVTLTLKGIEAEPYFNLCRFSTKFFSTLYSFQRISNVDAFVPQAKIRIFSTLQLCLYGPNSGKPAF